MELTNISTIKDLMARHGMTFSKSLGQNFLINPSVSPKIAELGGVTKETGVLEIGPGIGVLTKELAQRGKKVVAIELDNRLLSILDETLKDYDNVKIIQGDVLHVDLHQLLKDEFEGMDVVVCANLPYYITSPIIMKLLESKLNVKSITAMVQKEAGERIAAPFPSRQVGAITASIAYYAHADTLFTVSPGSFIPAPKVDSVVIKLNVYNKTPLELASEDAYFKTVKAAFSQRRKTLSNSLSGGLQTPKGVINRMLEQAGVDGSLRAEQLTLEDFSAIADEVATMLE